MGKQKAAANTDEPVKQALLKIAQADGPLRLSGRGDTPPRVFASTAGVNGQVIARLKDAAKPLVVESGGGANARVTLTAAGFGLIADSIPEEKLAGAVAALTEGLPAAERIAFLQEIVGRTPTATAELLPVLEAAVAEEKAESEARAEKEAKRRKAEAASLAALERWMATLEQRRKQRIESLIQELAAEGIQVGDVVQPPLPQPNSEDEASFQRQVARRLVVAWQQQTRLNQPQGVKAIEMAMSGITGLRPIGETGEEVGFDPELHETSGDVRNGERVRVRQRGWVLAQQDGPYALARAVVETGE